MNLGDRKLYSIQPRQNGKTIVALAILALSFLLFPGNIQAAGGVTQRSVGWYLLDNTLGLANQNLSSPDPLTGTDEIGFERQLYSLINQTRASNGLPPL